MVTRKAARRRPAAPPPRKNQPELPRDAWDEVFDAARRIPARDLAKFPRDAARRLDDYLEGLVRE